MPPNDNIHPPAGSSIPVIHSIKNVRPCRDKARSSDEKEAAGIGLVASSARWLPFMAKCHNRD
ncbi:MAG: hypothetical protein MUD10_03105 [Candidatus Pacebacteria bacterium]|nr:hypothetical protein [Candidatus Paceibacterota bacterium]